MSLTTSPDGKELLAGTIGGKIYRILTDNLSFLLHTDAHTGSVNDVHFNPAKADQFVCIDELGTVKIWDLTEYKSVFTATTGK